FAGAMCGNASAAQTMSDVTIELRPTATFEGEVLGKKNPVAVLKLNLSLAGAPEVFARTTTTSGEGSFFFDRVMSGLPLRLSANAAGKQISLAESYFEPGERRRASRFRIDPDDLDDPQPPEPLVNQWERKLRDARLAKMHLLVAIHDDDPQATKFVPRWILDDEESPSIID